MRSFGGHILKAGLNNTPQFGRPTNQMCATQIRSLEKDRRLAELYINAVTGQTGIDCFDAWVNELISIGYLHNHARMWFASIWIFSYDCLGS